MYSAARIGFPILLFLILFVIVSLLRKGATDAMRTTGVIVPRLIRPRFGDGANMSVCLNDWHKLASSDQTDFTHCVRVFLNVRTNWVQAQEMCNRYHNAHLVSIDDDRQLGMIRNLIHEEVIKSGGGRREFAAVERQFWIGLGQLCPNTDPLVAAKLRWTDKSVYEPNKQQFWKNNHTLILPDNPNWRQPHCVSYGINRWPDNSSRFRLQSCDIRLSFVCKTTALRQYLGAQPGVIVHQFEAVNDDKTDSAWSSVQDEQNPCGRDPFWCPLSQKTNNGKTRVKCYHLSTDVDYWDRAEEKCRSKYDGHLASIHTGTEMHFINNITRIQPLPVRESHLWIGLHRRNYDRTYQWNDGSPNDYLAGIELDKDSSENDNNNNGNCVALKIESRQEALIRQRLNAVREHVPSRLWRNHSMFSVAGPENNIDWMNQRCDNKLPAVCQKPGFGSDMSIEPKPIAQTDPTKKCSDGWKKFKGKCYRLYGTEANEMKSFDEATVACMQGGKPNHFLVSITDVYEQFFVLSLLREKHANAWIGLNVTAGRMRWIDDVPLSYSRFSPTNRIIHTGNNKIIIQSRNNFGFAQEACVYMDGTVQVGYWDLVFKNIHLRSGQTDMRGIHRRFRETCSNLRLPYICEKYPDEPIRTAATGRTIQFDDVCEQYNEIDAQNMTSFCFIRRSFDTLAFHTVPLTQGTWNQAKSICRGFRTLTPRQFHKTFEYGNLPSVHSLFEWAFLTAKASEIGYSQFWMGLKFRNNSFEWDDNWPLKMSPWGPGEPDVTKGHCVAARLDTDGPVWVMKNCADLLPFVCKLTNQDAPTSTSPGFEPAKCPSDKPGWIGGRTRCYYMVSDSSQITTGYRADHDCFRLHKSASLASFPTADDFEAFKNHIHSGQLTIPYAFIGLIRQQEGSFAWADHSPVTFVNWAPGQPYKEGKTHAQQECVQMQLKGNFTWFDVSCWQSRHFVCSVKALSADSGTALSTISVPGIATSTIRSSTVKMSSIISSDVSTATVKVSTVKSPDKNSISPDKLNDENSESGSMGLIVVSIVLTTVFMIALILGAVYFLRGRIMGTSSSSTGRDWCFWSSSSGERHQPIIHFDPLHNEEDFD